MTMFKCEDCLFNYEQGEKEMCYKCKDASNFKAIPEKPGLARLTCIDCSHAFSGLDQIPCSGCVKGSQIDIVTTPFHHLAESTKAFIETKTKKVFGDEPETTCINCMYALKLPTTNPCDECQNGSWFNPLAYPLEDLSKTTKLMIRMKTKQVFDGVKDDPVNHPAHYTSGKIEVIDFIEDQRLGFHEANAVKYVCRAKLKGNELEDLEKARWYLDRLISLKEGGE